MGTRTPISVQPLSTHRPNIVSRIFPAGPPWVTFCDSRPGKALSSLCLIIFFTYIDVIEACALTRESRRSKFNGKDESETVYQTPTQGQ